MQDLRQPSSSSSTTSTTTTTTTTASTTTTKSPLLTREQFIELVDTYMEGTQDIRKLMAITPEALHDLLLREQYESPEELLFRPVFKGLNLPGKDQDEKEGKKRPNDDSRRARVLKVLCDKLKEYPSGNLMLKMLLQKQSASAAKTVLHVAAQSQYSVNAINYLLQLASDLKIPNYVNSVDNLETGLGATPLYFATDALQIENMQALLQQGANPLAKTCEGVSVYQKLVEKVSDQRATKGVTLLQQSSPTIKKSLNPYTRFSPGKTSPSSPPPLDQKAVPSSGNDALQKIINVKLLLDFVNTKEINLSSFVGFLQGLSTIFAGDKSENTALRQQFLKDFDNIQSQFMQAVKNGVLNADMPEQREILSVASWLMNQQRYTAALALFQRLLSDKYSVFLQDQSQVYKMLRWSAICIGKIFVEQKKSTLVETEFLGPIHEIDNLKELREALETVAANKKLLPAFQKEIADLLSQFHRGQAHLSPVLDSVPKEVKHILTSPTLQTRTFTSTETPYTTSTISITTATTTTTATSSLMGASSSSSSTIGILDSQADSSQMVTTSISLPLTAPGRTGYFGSSSGSSTTIASTTANTTENTLSHMSSSSIPSSSTEETHIEQQHLSSSQG